MAMSDYHRRELKIICDNIAKVGDAGIFNTFVDKLVDNNVLTEEEKCTLQCKKDIHYSVFNLYETLLSKDDSKFEGCCRAGHSTQKGEDNLSSVKNQDPNDESIRRRMLAKHPEEARTLTLPYIMSVRDEIDEANLREADLPVMVAKYLTRLDYKGRDELCELFKQSEEQAGNAPFMSKLSKFKKATIKFKKIGPHPQDIMVNVLRGSDQMLKQVIAQKCFQCKLAFPFIIPSQNPDQFEVLLKALESTVLNWIDKSSSQPYEKTAAGVSFDVVSFIHVGKHRQFSKSKFINHLFFDKHRTFFNRDCHMGIVDRQIATGTIEAQWYLPGLDQGILDSVTLILNLRGSVTDWPEQGRFLNLISTVVIVAAELSEVWSPKFKEMLSLFSKCHQSNRLVVFLLHGNDFRHPEGDDSSIEWVRTYKEDYQLRSFEEISGECISILYKKLVNYRQKITTKEIKKMLQPAYFTTNENTETKNHIEMMSDLIVSRKGVAWDDWAQVQILSRRKADLNRKCYMLTTLDSEDLDTVHNDLRVLDAKLEVMALSFRDRTLIGQLVPILDSTISNHTADKLCYFCIQAVLDVLTDIKQCLDDISRERLPPLISEYIQIYGEFSEMKKMNVPSSDGQLKLKECSQKLLDATDNLALASYGLEHILRELGIIYSNLCSHDISHDGVLQSFLHKIPSVIANLMLEGHPLEIMDGDSSYVNSQFLRAVIKSLKKIIGNSSVFVLSVLGVQSSGKSTLLNAMFGLQFAVGAGRCTKGIFAQLVRLDKDVKEQYNISSDYIMVIDTEGLRAIELHREGTNFRHDNELATLAVGIADTTIMNISGENYSDMQDVIQIVVHAFLRMKLVSKRQHCNKSCIFVHQNVTALDAKLQTSSAIRALRDSLDIAAKNSALQENIPNIKCFDDIIEFDYENHVFHFTGLFAGDPPMAHVNSGYVLRVLDLKKGVYGLINKASETKTVLSIAEIYIRIADIWEGILSDSFVFSFRNTLEVSAYCMLENKFGELSRKFESVQNTRYVSEAVKRFGRCRSASKIEAEKYAVIQDIETNLAHDAEHGLIRKLETYCVTEGNCTLLNIWESQRTAMLERVIALTLNKILQAIDRMKNKRIGEMKIEKQVTPALLEKAQKKVNSLKKHYSDKQLMEKNYDDFLKSILSSDNRSFPSYSSIQKIVLDLLRKRFFKNERSFRIVIVASGFTESKQSKRLMPLKHSLNQKIIDTFVRRTTEYKDDVFDEHLSLSMTKGGPSLLDAFLHRTNIIFSLIDDYLDTLIEHNTRFNETIHVHIITDTFFDKHLCKLAHDLFRSPEVLMSIALYMFQLVIPKFCFMTDMNDNRYGMSKHKLSKTASLKSILDSSLETECAEDAAAYMISQSLKTYIKSRTESSIGFAVYNKVKATFQTKDNLLRAIYTDLVKRNTYEFFAKYLQNSRMFAVKWISDHINKHHFRKEGEFASFINSQLTKTVSIITSLITSTPNKRVRVDQGKYLIISWLQAFTEKVAEFDSNLNMRVFSCIPHSIYISDIRKFRTKLNELVKKLVTQIIFEMADLNSSSIYWNSTSFEELVFGMWGCQEICPFCSEPCQLSDPDHLKRGMPHLCFDHRPLLMKGITEINGKKLYAENCNVLIQPKAKNVEQDKNDCPLPWNLSLRDINADWDIPPKPDTSNYWLWVLNTYKNQFLRCANVSVEKLSPHRLKKLSKNFIVESLIKETIV